MKNGFTLVELSIVLVIIGLLVGGILVGQSLIDSAKVNSFVRELQQYKIMVEQFESRYRSLPGDTSLFPVTGRGSAVAGDYILTDNDNSGAQNYNSEIAHFWKHLSDANMISEDLVADASSGIRVGINTPEMVYDNASAVPVLSIGGIHSFILSDYSAHTDDSTAANVPVLTAVQALSIDTKIDDGLAITDSFTGSGGFDYTDQMWAGGDSDCWASLTPPSGPKSYNTSDPDAECVPFLRYR